MGGYLSGVMQPKRKALAFPVQLSRHPAAVQIYWLNLDVKIIMKTSSTEKEEISMKGKSL